MTRVWTDNNMGSRWRRVYDRAAEVQSEMRIMQRQDNHQRAKVSWLSVTVGRPKSSCQCRIDQPVIVCGCVCVPCRVHHSAHAAVDACLLHQHWTIAIKFCDTSPKVTQQHPMPCTAPHGWCTLSRNLHCCLQYFFLLSSNFHYRISVWPTGFPLRCYGCFA